MEIEFKNGSKIESLPSNDVTRGNGQLSNVRFFDNETGEEIFGGSAEVSVETIESNVYRDFNYNKEMSFDIENVELSDEFTAMLEYEWQKKFMRLELERLRREKAKERLIKSKNEKSNQLRDAQNKFHKHGKRW